MEFRILRIVCVSVFLSVFFACEKEVEIEIPGYKEQLVIDGFIENGQPPFVLISTSKDIFAPTDLNSFLNGFVSGAIVSVSDGTNSIQLTEICTDDLPPGTEEIAAAVFGLPVDQIANYHLCAYTTFNPSFFGQIGKTYTLTVNYEGKTYTSSTQILTPQALDNLFWKTSPGSSEYGFSYVTFSEPGSTTTDGYMWQVKRINKNPDGSEKDAFFKKTFNPVFDDEFINGKTFEFWYENPFSYDDSSYAENFKGFYKKGDTVVVKFSRLEPSVYEFFEKKYVQLSSGGSPFASPSNIPTNISGGALGVWAGFANYFDTLICQ